MVVPEHIHQLSEMMLELLEKRGRKCNTNQVILLRKKMSQMLMDELETVHIYLFILFIYSTPNT